MPSVIASVLYVCIVQASKVWHKLTQLGVLPFMTQRLGLLAEVSR